jgi:hypothetical protein
MRVPVGKIGSASSDDSTQQGDDDTKANDNVSTAAHC